MISGMSSINKYLNKPYQTRSAFRTMQSLNIYEQAACILKTVQDSIDRFNDTVGNASDVLLDVIPVDGQPEMLINEYDLPPLSVDEAYVYMDKYNDFIGKLMNQVDSSLQFTISVTQTLTKVIELRVSDGVLYIENVAFKVRDELIDEVNFAICKTKILINNEYINVSDIFRQIMLSDELNRVNQCFLSAIAKGEDTLDVILNRASIEFSDAMDDTKEYLKFIASNIEHGASGFMAILKQMFTMITTGVYSSTNRSITFTDNSQYVMKNFTAGIIEGATNIFSNLWNATKDVFAFAAAVVGTVVKKGYDIVSSMFDSILSQYISSKFNFKANSSNFAIGIIQSEITAEDWNEFSNQGLSFSDLYLWVKNQGPQKVKVPWGTMFFWVNIDDPDTIFIEHKLRTDVKEYVFPIALRFPMTGGALDINSLDVISHTTNRWGVFSMYQDRTAGDQWDGAQHCTFGQLRFPTSINSMLADINEGIVSINDLYSTQEVPTSEKDRSAYIENAYAIFLTCVIWSNMLNYQSSGYSQTWLNNENPFTPSSSSFRLNSVYGLLYTVAFFFGRRSNVSMFSENFPLTNNTAWNYLNGTMSSLNQSGNVFHICSYTPLVLIHCPVWLNLQTYVPLYVYDWTIESQYLIGLSKPESVYPQLNTVMVGTVLAKNPAILSIFIMALLQSKEYSNYNLQSGFLFGAYGGMMNGDDIPFFTPPNYTKSDIVSGILLITGVILGVALLVSVPTFIIKRKLRAAATLRAARVEHLWSEAVKDPSKTNVKAYRKAVSRNNIQSRMFGGQIFSKSSYWGTNNDNLLQNSSFLSSALLGNKDANVTDIIDLIRGV